MEFYTSLHCKKIFPGQACRLRGEDRGEGAPPQMGRACRSPGTRASAASDLSPQAGRGDEIMQLRHERPRSRHLDSAEGLAYVVANREAIMGQGGWARRHREKTSRIAAEKWQDMFPTVAVAYPYPWEDIRLKE